MTVKQQITRLVCLGLLLAMPLASVHGGPIVLAPQERGQATVTRDVAEYSGHEQALMAAALASGNGMPTLLADDFEAWSTDNGWQSKEEWLSSVQHIKSFVIKEVSVRLLDGLVVVQFLLQTHGRKGSHPQNKIVVDIWRQSSQQLAVRYTTVSPASRPNAALSLKR